MAKKGERYGSLAEVAKAHGVSKPAVTKWTRHPQWPGTLEREAVDRFVAEWIKPHRRSSGKASDGKKVRFDAKASGGEAAVNVVKQAGAAVKSLDQVEEERRLTPEQLDRKIDMLQVALLAATNPAETGVLKDKVVGLKGVLDMQIKRRDLVSRTEVERGWTERITATKARMFSVPRQVAEQLVGLTAAEIEAVLVGEMVKICGEFARER